MGPKRDRLVFAGAVHEAEPALRALLGSPCEISAIVTPPQSQAAQLCGFSDLAPLARQHGIPVVRTTDINEPATASFSLAGMDRENSVSAPRKRFSTTEHSSATSTS